MRFEDLQLNDKIKAYEYFTLSGGKDFYLYNEDKVQAVTNQSLSKMNYHIFQDNKSIFEDKKSIKYTPKIVHFLTNSVLTTAIELFGIKELETKYIPSYCPIYQDGDNKIFISYIPYSITMQMQRDGYVTKFNNYMAQNLIIAQKDANKLTNIKVIDGLYNNFSYEEVLKFLEEYARKLNIDFKQECASIRAYRDYKFTRLENQLDACATIWKNHLVDFIELIVNKVDKNNINNKTMNFIKRELISKLDFYELTEDDYTRIYQILKTVFGYETAKSIVIYDSKLTIKDLIAQIEQIKRQIPEIPNVNEFKSDIKLSDEQYRAVTNTSKLSLMPSVAGSGKSTCILERVKFLELQGIDPSDIMVLSFTTTAAENIKNKNPKIKSSTTASLINKIYNHNFDKCELSNARTMRHKYESLFNSNLTNFEKVFFSMLTELEKNQIKPQAFASLVAQSINDVLNIIQKTKLTTFMLQTIICNVMIDALDYDNSMRCRHLIVDEVQDNSIYEFIYVLSYTKKFKNTLMFVGDPAQTLYEFRNADPKALNVLELSGLFDIYKLQTNFRSKDAILQMGNTMLNKIGVNKISRLKLIAFEDKTDKEDFQNRVRYAQASKMTPFERVYQESSLKSYIDTLYKIGQEICFLAHTNKAVRELKELVQKNYPNAKLIDITKETFDDTTIFSKFARDEWDNIDCSSVENFCKSLQEKFTNYLEMELRSSDVYALTESEIKKRKETLQQIYRTQNTKLNNFVESAFDVLKDLYESVETDVTIPKRLKELFIKYEVDENSMRSQIQQNEVARQREDIIKEKVDFKFATIHTAKGLEFDNVVLYIDETFGLNQELYRMYYVGLTRAKNTEFLIVHKKGPFSIIQTLHESTKSKL